MPGLVNDSCRGEKANNSVILDILCINHFYCSHKYDSLALVLNVAIVQFLLALLLLELYGVMLVRCPLEGS